MQHAGFRRCYVDPIPDGARLPYPIAELPRVDYLENQVGEQILAATSKAFT
jgi:hypothetical protein